MVAAEPRTWSQVADQVTRQALKEIADSLKELRSRGARGFLAHRETDLVIGAPLNAFVPMDGLTWEPRPDGAKTASEYFIPEPGVSNPASWRPSRPEVPWLVFAAVRCNVAVGVMGQLDLVDLNEGRVLRRLGEQVPSSAGTCQLVGITIFIPEQGQQLGLRLEAGGWTGGSGLVSGRSTDNLRSYWGAFCLQP